MTAQLDQLHAQLRSRAEALRDGALSAEARDAARAVCSELTLIASPLGGGQRSLSELDAILQPYEATPGCTGPERAELRAALRLIGDAADCGLLSPEAEAATNALRDALPLR